MSLVLIPHQYFADPRVQHTSLAEPYCQADLCGQNVETHEQIPGTSLPAGGFQC